MALARDPAFWRRFSRAIHMDEEAKSSENKEGTYNSDTWIQSQRRKSRRSIICGVVLVVLVALLIAAVAVILWYFISHDWLREHKDEDGDTSS
ncbi:hypothetical protein N8T08_004724 [Aspergillus melleus]|uniref:Uncharacterized protein n=1 Tax=Aspergillus melleus TaxID=138277 RepID=A0ACC3B408_9EURO|nr:hypothetical protein N8T08_004724 [Aspergillus melleus]